MAQHIDANLFANEETEFTVHHNTGSIWLSIGESGNDFTVFPPGAWCASKHDAESQLRWLYEKAAKMAEDCQTMIEELRNTKVSEAGSADSSNLSRIPR